MLPALIGIPAEVAAATAARQAALVTYVDAGRASDAARPDLVGLWPGDPTDLNALLVLADRTQDQDNADRAIELRDVVAHVRWADTARLWRSGSDFPLAQRAAATRTLRAAQPGTVASDAFDRLPPAAPTAVVRLGAAVGRIAREVAAALAAEPDIFARAADAALVYVHPASDRGELVASELTGALLPGRVADAVRLRSPAGARTALPGGITRAVLDDRDRSGFRRLSGIVARPVIAADGTVIADRRYHRSTGLLVCPPAGLSLDVPHSPNRDDAIRAIEVLLDVVRDFPFRSAADRSAWLAVVLTPLVRAMIDGPTPWLVAVGNSPGIGKGLLLDVAGLILAGQPLARSVWSRSGEVTRRTIDQQFLHGADLFLFDNIVGRVGNPEFDAALTAARWTYRGRSGPLRTVWLATGNDLQWGADAERRVLPIRLHTTLERPESRTDFRRARLEEHVLTNRGQLLSAALTVVRAWVNTGRPREGLAAWGSFGAWSDVVREMLVWADQPDPIATRTPLCEATSDELAGTILEAISQLCAGRIDPRHRRGVTAVDLVAAAAPVGVDMPEWQAELSPALSAVFGGHATPIATGKYLQSLVGRVFGERRLVHAVTADGTPARTKQGMLWTVAPVAAAHPT